MNGNLRFNEDGSFTILQLTDMHYVNDDEPNAKTTALAERLIKQAKPDFIMITGDTVYGARNADLIGKALAPVADSGIPWSLVFGNHDTENGAGYAELVAELAKLPNGHFADDKTCPAGVGNHFIEIKNKAGETRWALCGLDSGNYCPNPDVGGYAWIQSAQIAWYTRKTEDLKSSSPDAAILAFFHIPLPEFNDAWGKVGCVGVKQENVECARINSGLFAAMLEGDRTRGVFCGHDHINDYMSALHGITLAYGRASGYNTYSAPGFEHGGRVISFSEDDTIGFGSYIILESGRELYRA